MRSPVKQNGFARLDTLVGRGRELSSNKRDSAVQDVGQYQEVVVDKKRTQQAVSKRRNLDAELGIEHLLTEEEKKVPLAAAQRLGRSTIHEGVGGEECLIRQLASMS